MEQTVYSIVIPHYNCPDLLVRCLKSIPERSDIQIIVTDDHSDDRKSVENMILSLGRSNIEYYYLDKGWAGHARNVGMGLAKGKWVIFCDADDYFTSNAFHTFDSYNDSDSDMVYYKHNAAYTDSGNPCVRFPVRNESIDKYLGNKNENSLNDLLYRDVVPWAKMYRNSFLQANNFMYEEIRSNEDVMFVVSCNVNASKICVSDSVVYTITMRPGSLTMSVNRDNMFTGYGVAIRYSKFVKSQGYPKYSSRLLSYIRLAWKHYGFKEVKRYVKEAKLQDISIFTGFLPSIKEIYRKFKSISTSDYYKG